MRIDLAPETAQLVREEISSGHFRSVGDLIEAGAKVLRERIFPATRLSTREPIIYPISFSTLHSPAPASILAVPRIFRVTLTSNERLRLPGVDASTARRFPF